MKLMDETRPKTAGHRLMHLAMILGTGFFHIICYAFVNKVTRWASLPIHDYSLFIDMWIPYMGWTWMFYYLGNFYILIGGGWIVWRLPDRKFHRAVYTYLAMILTGAVLEVVFAAASPWPPEMISLQRHMHGWLALDLYACLPSMHVALTVFPTCLSFSVFRSRLPRAFLVILAALITISTLTFKEHVFLDAAAGILLALVFYAVWRSGGRRENISEGRAHGS
jgi:hypothetical protein